MIVSPGAKINLGLYVTAKRADGFHDLLSFFYPIEFSDSLEVLLAPTGDPYTYPAAWANRDKLSPANLLPTRAQVPGLSVDYTSSGLSIDGALENNLCIKAYRLLHADFPGLPGIAMHLHKNVPMGAGLGGGSADGAATLKIMNQLGRLELPARQLLLYAEQLGSDCPFFIKNEPQIATGKGEMLRAAPLSLKGYILVLVCPPIQVPTKLAFSQINPQAGPDPETFLQLIQSGPQNWTGQLSNQFEKGVFEQFPVIRRIKEQLYDLGATYAAMTGSGSSVFGLFATTTVPDESIPLPFGDSLVRRMVL